MTRKKNSLPTVPEEISATFTVARRTRRWALTCEWKPVIPRQKNCGWWGRIIPSFFSEIWKRTGDLSDSFLMRLTTSREKRRTVSSCRQTKPYSLLSHVTCILQVESFAFKPSPVAKTHRHQAMPPHLKQYGVAETHAIFFFCYSGDVCKIKNFEILQSGKEKKGEKWKA